MEIIHQFRYPHPPEVVWEYLTDPALLALWLMPNNFKAEVGHKFQFTVKPKINLGFDGNIYCEVLDIVPQQRLVYSWKGGMSKDKPSLDSVVTWTLTAAGDETVLQLAHTGFKGMKNYLTYLIMNKGWMKIGKRFGQHLNPSLHDRTRP